MEYRIVHVTAVVLVFVCRAFVGCTANRVTITIPKTLVLGEDGYRYTGLNSFGYSVGNTTSFEFMVKTCSGAQVALMSGPTERSQLYEVVISGLDNSETVVRKYKGGAVMIKSHGGMLDCSKYRAFQIHWEDGVISLVRKCRLGKWLQILSWKDSHPRPVRYIGVTTGSWASSTWKFNQDVVEDPDSKRILEFETDMQRGLNYYYKHLTDFKYELGHRTSITFSVKACSDIHVALLSRDVGACDMYEVLIGGYANTLSTIRRGKNGYNFVTKSSSPADCNAFKSFKITWDLGLVTVWYESEIATWHFLMSWRDPKPINVRYIGMTTGKATSGTWKLQL